MRSGAWAGRAELGRHRGTLGERCPWGCCAEEGRDCTQVWTGPLFLGEAGASE